MPAVDLNSIMRFSMYLIMPYSLRTAPTYLITEVLSEEHVSTLVLLFAGSAMNGRNDNVPIGATPSPGVNNATSATVACLL